jgi:hypothetical protein
VVGRAVVLRDGQIVGKYVRINRRVDPCMVRVETDGLTG